MGCLSIEEAEGFWVYFLAPPYGEKVTHRECEIMASFVANYGKFCCKLWYVLLQIMVSYVANYGMFYCKLW